MKPIFMLWMMLAISSAQSHLSPISAATAQTFGTFYRGMDAVGGNPANLAYQSKEKYTTYQTYIQKDTTYYLEILQTPSKSKSDSLFFLLRDSLYIQTEISKRDTTYEQSVEKTDSPKRNSDILNLDPIGLTDEETPILITETIYTLTTPQFAEKWGADSLGLLLSNNGIPESHNKYIITIHEEKTPDENYRINKEKFFFLEVLNVGVLAGNSSVDADWLNTNVFNSGYLDDSKKEDFLSIFPDDGLKINPLLQTRFGLRLGSTAIQISPEIYGELVIPTGLFDFALNGIRFDTPTDLSGYKTQFQAVVPIGVSTGWRLKTSFLQDYILDTYIGCGIKFLMGGAYFETEFDTLQLTSGSEDVTMQAVITSTYNLGGPYMMPDPDRMLSYTLDKSQTSGLGDAGNGYAVDIGLMTNINEKWIASLAVINLLGKIKWSGETSYKHDLKMDFFATTEEIEESDVDSLLQESVQVDSSYHINSFTTPYPGKIIMGIEYALQNLTLAANFQKGFTNEFGSSTVPRLSFASEYRPAKWFSLLAGTSFGGAESFQWGTGFSFRLLFYQLNFGFSQYGGMFNSAKGFSLSLSNSIVF